MPKCWDCGSQIHVNEPMKLVKVELLNETVKMAHHEECAENMEP